MKKIKKGKFYSVLKHPGFIVSADDRNNRYLAVMTGTSDNTRHKVQLKHPIEPGIKRSYVQNRPYLGKRKHFGSHELVGLRFHPDDMPLVEEISKKPPRKLH